MIISTGTRLHLTLIDLAGASLRTFGGVGISLNYPRTVLEVEPSTALDIENFSTLDGTTTEDIDILLNKMMCIGLPSTLKLTLLEHPPQHSGFGSKTSLLLSIAGLLNKYFNLELTNLQLQTLTGRGGASGVGIHSFFYGGVVIDGGHNCRDGTFSPSSVQSHPDKIPPMILRTTLPTDWKIALILPVDCRVLNGKAEVEFFESNTPIPEIDALRVMASVYHGILPAIAEHDFIRFKEAIEIINCHGFKKIEIQAQKPIVNKTLRKLNAHQGIVAGMSSLGPLIYAIVDSQVSGSDEHIDSVAHSEALKFLGYTKADGHGHLWG